MIPEVVTHPLVPAWLLIVWLVAALPLLGVALARRARGWSMRALALAALGAALLDPRVVQEERRPRPDLALVVVDQSPSQNVGDRASMADAARAKVEAALAALDGVEVRTIRTGADVQGETRLFEAIERAALDGGDRRLAAIVIISDGQVHDVPAPGSTPWLKAPVHLLLTGGKDERDRRIVVEQAPAYGIVDQTVESPIASNRPGRRRARANTSASARASTARSAARCTAQIDRSATFPLPIRHAGPTVLELEVEPADEEVSTLNNRTAVVVNGVRERLRVLLVSGQPHPGERTWRNLLKSDPAVDLVHFTILRPPEKDDATPLKELSLIVFPVQELFENKLYDFDLVVFDRYVARGILPNSLLRSDRRLRPTRRRPVGGQLPDPSSREDRAFSNSPRGSFAGKSEGSSDRAGFSPADHGRRPA